jgi:signal transduction histidine kinase
MRIRVNIGQIAVVLLSLLGVCSAVGMTLGHWSVVLTAGVVVLLLVTAASVLLSSWVLAPGRTLMEAIQRMGEGGEVERLAAHRGPARFRDLVECINEMASLAQGNAYFLADVAHQLRSELQLLQTRLERLEGQLLPGGREAHAYAMADVERLHSTLTEHLELARLIETREPAEVDMCGVASVRARAWSEVAARRSVKIRTLLNGAPVVLTRHGVLEQLLDILLDNAVRYSPRWGVIIVSVEYEDHEATLRVLDEGPGMAADERERATVRGWRGGEAQWRARKAQGAGDGRGLGLSIANMLVAQSGGRLSLDPGPEGRGLDAACVFPKLS